MLLARSPALEALLSALSGRDVVHPPRAETKRRYARHAKESEPDTSPSHRFMLSVVVAYCNGSTQQQIATELGVHVQTIRATLRDDELQTIRRLRADGVSAHELGRRYNVAHTTILRQLR